MEQCEEAIRATARVVTAALPDRALGRAAARHAAGGHRFHGADGRLPDLPAAHGGHGHRALPPRLRHTRPAERVNDRAGVAHRDRPAQLPVRHLRRHHHEPVPAVQQIPGVAVAAPLAMAGYSLPPAPLLTVPLPAAEGARLQRQLYRYTTTWVSAAGTTRIRQPPSFVYVTPDRLSVNASTGATSEVLPGGSRAAVCQGDRGPAASPFGPAAQSDLWCWSRVNGLGSGSGSEGYQGLTAQRPGFTVGWAFPMLIAAIDPVAEAKLDGLNHAVTSGRYLSETAGPGVVPLGSGSQATAFPVLAASTSGGGGEIGSAHG